MGSFVLLMYFEIDLTSPYYLLQCWLCCGDMEQQLLDSGAHLVL